MSLCHDVIVTIQSVGEKQRYLTDFHRLWWGGIWKADENFVPLHCQIEDVDRRSLKVEIARVKSGNCAH